MNRILVLPVKCLKDNYSYIVKCTRSNKGVIIDPVEPAKAFKVAMENDVEVVQALVTHHHLDHHNIKDLLEIKRIPVISGDDRIPNSELIKDGQEWQVGDFSIKAIFTPGHTTGHYSYYIYSKDEHNVFTGDFLFIGGCGRLFEGTAQMMWNSILKFKDLPKSTNVWVGHEYTASNYNWALSIDPNNKSLADKLDWASSAEITIPSTVQNEMDFNMFLHSDDPRMLKRYNTADPVNVLTQLRAAKDAF